MMSPRIITSIAAVLAGVPLAAHAQPDAAEPARPRLISETTGLVPGARHTIALTFDIDLGWHTYWPGQNDTGQPIEFTLGLPPGFESAPPAWPAPRRYELPGDILDHGYEKEEATILISVFVPADAEPGEKVRFVADTEWLVCREACIPGWGTVELELPILEPGVTPEPGPDAGRIAAARRRLPVPLPEHPTDVSMRWKGGVLEITARCPVDLMTFSPHETSRRIEQIRSTGVSTDGTLRLKPGAGDGPVRGVLELVLGSGVRPRLYRIETRVPSE